MEYRDYRYILQDTGTLYVGSRFSLGDLCEDVEVPFKFRAILNTYIMRELDPDTTLESLLYYMEGKGMVYQTFLALRTRIKVSEQKKIKKLGGKETFAYREQIYALTDFVAMSEAQKQKKGIMIQEIQCSKLAIMTFSL